MKKTLFQILFITPFIGLYYLFRYYEAHTIVLVVLYAWIVIGLIVHAAFGKVSQQSPIYDGPYLVWLSVIWPYTICKRIASRSGENRGS